ncbi:TPA: hypothetical protein CPT79_02355 [Candidatus Gastranaerophilales bacterium HUM_6]|nr:unknown [Fusobacterium sp. CAG:815]DAA91468.1 MAG TPA: hypothetical protein CPT93_07850 [Candidatus Gastranaerophilales bacterium HUM_7]DAA92996.1 MAG TPA: hypothetical protein CPT79_02355 [Candidatus Gastranaerophilales bacterium HUM_6]DAB02935.1 MAG TPA: hypothetical protein CPT84_03690 [Candidatus Gastranaerophilales bacterium HUM_12]DAB04948.1 MAG TPA: hypothetical protein CPT78_08300 [Candidatus Gastranaerophilales bacterium HUM_14]
MIVTNIISAIGNNSSIYPLLVRDCCIEAPSKILIARKENLKESKEIANDATREKIIDEYATSGIWLGGIPMVEYFSDKFISKKGYNPIVNLNLFKAEKNKEAYQGIEYNINKFKNIQAKDVQDAVQDSIKVKNNKGSFEKLLTKKFCAATIIPTIIMGFVLPKLNFALTKKIREKKVPQKAESKKEISFTGSFTSQIANLRTVDKMAISDGGLTVGRVTTSRNKDEAWANAFRMIGSMILNFVTPIYIAKGLDKLANKLFNINVNLDPKILADNEFINTIKNSKVELPKSNTEKDLIDFIDNKPQALFSRFAQKTGKVSYLKSGYRDPRKFVDIKDLGKFRNEFENFIAKAKQSKNIENFARKAKFVKSANILANVGISSFLLAGVLPAATYKFIKLTTGSYSDPGLVQNKK